MSPYVNVGMHICAPTYAEIRKPPPQPLIRSKSSTTADFLLADIVFLHLLLGELSRLAVVEFPWKH
jgi:hypothetical protein